MNVYKNLTEIIGKTPLLELNNYKKSKELKGNILAKLEFMNPAGSVKDRIAKGLIEDAESRGLIKDGAVIIEPTSGNTGIGLASIATAKGYKSIMVMPETMSVERQKLIKAYGSEIVLTDGSLGMSGAVAKAEELTESIENSFLSGQFVNQANPETHYTTTGPEIWNDTDGNVDIFVAGIGTGGTLSGNGKYLKEKNPNIKIIGVEPKDSPVLTKGEAGPHKLQGLGANFVPDTLDREIYDEVVTVSNEDAYSYARDIALSEGILVGISSGAAMVVASELAMRDENQGKNIVVVFPDTGSRYLSTEGFIF